MKIDENVWKFVQQRLGYSDEDLAKFRQDPRNEEVLTKAGALMSKSIVAEVVSSHGCNSQHKVGDRFHMDGAGNLISKLCPDRMCLYAVSALKPLVFSANELLYAGADPNKMVFKRCACSDVGLECGGWGRVVMEISVTDRASE